MVGEAPAHNEATGRSLYAPLIGGAARAAHGAVAGHERCGRWRARGAAAGASDAPFSPQPAGLLQADDVG
jgi:hypothetical protein